MPEQSDAVFELCVEAYTYLYPLVTMDLTRRQAITTGSPVLTAGPANTFVHIREFPSAEFKGVVRPNFDTLYSLAWLDLTSGPVVVSSAAVTDGRYFELPMYDMWTDEFAVPAQRTTGSDAGSWAVVPPGWIGEVPSGVDRIDSPTPYVWIIGRTQTNGPSDYSTVHTIQDGYAITPLADLGDEARPAPTVEDETIDLATPPLFQVTNMSASEFFTYGMGLLALHPPHLTDWPLIAQMRRIGLVADAGFDAVDDEVRAVLEGVPKAAQQAMQEAIPRMANIVNGWQMNIETMGVYGNSYVKRAVVDVARPRLERGRGCGVSDPAHRWRRQSRQRRQRLRHALRRRRTATRTFVLVGNDVRPGRLPGPKRDQPIRDRRPRPAALQHRRLARHLRAASGSRPGQVRELATSASRPVRDLCAALPPDRARILRGTWAPPPLRRS